MSSLEKKLAEYRAKKNAEQTKHNLEPTKNYKQSILNFFARKDQEVRKNMKSKYVTLFLF